MSAVKHILPGGAFFPPYLGTPRPGLPDVELKIRFPSSTTRVNSSGFLHSS